MAIIKLALLGASGSGTTQLARELSANALLLPLLLVDDNAPLQRLVASRIDMPEPFADRADLLTTSRTHLENYDVTLLMGLDLPLYDTRQAAERMDGLLRRCLAETGIAYQVIYGQGDDRQQQAIQTISRLSTPLVPRDVPETTNIRKIDTGTPRPTLFGNGEKKSTWVWMCDKCSDAECEHRTFIAHQGSRLLQG